MRTSLATLGVAVVLTAAVSSASAGDARPEPPESPAAALQQGVSAIVAAGAPGALAVVRDGSGVSIARAGVSRLGGHRPIGPDDPFRVGSLTKTFVASLVLQLVAEGRLGLDDTLERRLPGAVPRGGEITVRQLLRHTSGLPDLGTGRDGSALLARLRADRRHVFTPAELVRSVAREPLRFRPGGGWAYSNTGYILLGLIAEKVTGKGLEQVLRERIFAPLRLDRTRVGSGAALPAGAVRGYLPPGNPFLRARGGRPVDVTETNPSWTWAAGAIVSTATDVDRFYRALLAGRLVPRRLLGEMTAARPIGGSAGYGLGLLRLGTPCGPLFGHDGEIFGYTTLAAATPGGRRSIVLEANVSAPESGAVLAAFVQLAGRALCGRSS